MIVHRARPWSSIKAHSWVCDKVQYYCFIPYLTSYIYITCRSLDMRHAVGRRGGWQ